MNYHFEMKNGTSYPTTDVNNNILFKQSYAFFLGNSHAEILPLINIHFDLIKAIPLRRKIIQFNSQNRKRDRRTIITCKV